MFEIRFSTGVWNDLKPLPIRDQRIILDTVEKQLTHQPAVKTKNRKILLNLVPPWQNTPPIWELRVAEYRVFYDVAEAEQAVYVRAVRYKPPHSRTEEIL
jgi:mRNA-degrading endonuclease RelE of RelBE toxin-antitoxin system